MDKKTFLGIIVLLGLLLIVWAVGGQLAPWEQPLPEVAEVPSTKLPEGSPVPADPALLLNTTWVWERTLLVDGTTTAPKQATAFTLVFGADGRVSGTTDCNTFGGQYQVGSDGVLTFSPFASTKMACEVSEEALFMGLLGKVSGYMLDPVAGLALKLNDDSALLVFQKQ